MREDEESCRLKLVSTLSQLIGRAKLIPKGSRRLPSRRPVNDLLKEGCHWDMVCDLRNGGEIWVDDALLYKDGQFVIEF